MKYVIIKGTYFGIHAGHLPELLRDKIIDEARRRGYYSRRGEDA